MTGPWILLRHYLRRDRGVALWYSIGAAVLYTSQAVSIDGLYTTPEAFDEAAAAMTANTAFIAVDRVRRDHCWAGERVRDRPPHPRRPGDRPRGAAPRVTGGPARGRDRCPATALILRELHGQQRDAAEEPAAENQAHSHDERRAA